MIWSNLFQKIILISAVIWFIRFCSIKLSLEIARTSSVIYAICLVSLRSEPLFIFAATILFVVAEIDRKEFRIPDFITKPALFFLTLYQATSIGLLVVAWGWVVVMYLVTTLLPKSIGRGDIKLIGALILLAPLLSERPPLSFLCALLLLSSALALPGAKRSQKVGRGHPFAPAISGASLALFGIGAI